MGRKYNGGGFFLYTLRIFSTWIKCMRNITNRDGATVCVLFDTGENTVCSLETHSIRHRGMVKEKALCFAEMCHWTIRFTFANRISSLMWWISRSFDNFHGSYIRWKLIIHVHRRTGFFLRKNWFATVLDLNRWHTEIFGTCAPTSEVPYNISTWMLLFLLYIERFDFQIEMHLTFKDNWHT